MEDTIPSSHKQSSSDSLNTIQNSITFEENKITTPFKEDITIDSFVTSNELENKRYVPPKPNKTPPSPKKKVVQMKEPKLNHSSNPKRMSEGYKSSFLMCEIKNLQQSPIPERPKSSLGERPSYEAPKPKKCGVLDKKTRVARRKIQSKSFVFVEGVPLNFESKGMGNKKELTPLREEQYPIVTIDNIPPSEVLDSFDANPIGFSKDNITHIEYQNSLTVIAHPIIRSLLTTHRSILQDAIQLNAILLLPPAYIINDIQLTKDFFYTHFILLDSQTLRFITLTQIPGFILDSNIKLFMSDVKDFIGSDFERFDEAMEIVKEVSSGSAPIFSTKINGVETYIGKETNQCQLNILLIKTPIFQHGCSWAWKLMDGNAPLSFNEYTIELSIDVTVERIKESIPGFIEQQRIDRMMLNDKYQPKFVSPIDDERRTELKANNQKQKSVYTKLLEMKQVTIKIDQFVVGFGEMVKGMDLNERKGVIERFIKEMIINLRKTKVFVNEEKLCFVVLQRLIHTRVFKHLWPPSVSVVEQIDIKEVQEDLLISNKIQDHQFVTPELLDSEFDENKAVVPLSYAINCLKQIDSVRTAQDKLVYIYIALKIIEMTIIFVTGNVSGDSFVPIVIYALIKANLPHLSSTVKYVMTFAETTRGAHSCYFCNFVAAVSFVTQINENSFHFEEEGLYQQFIQQTRESYEYSVKQRCPSVHPPRFLSLFDVSKVDEPQEQLYRMLQTSSDNFPREEIPTLLSVLKALYEENTALKQQANKIKQTQN